MALDVTNLLFAASGAILDDLALAEPLEKAASHWFRAAGSAGENMKVRDKVIVVTGAGNGIGRELVLCLLARGAKVAGIDLNPTMLQETTSLANTNETRFSSFVADISDRAAVQSLPDQVVAHFGAVDGLINNAGIIQPFTKLVDLDLPTIERVINVNLLGTLYMTKAFLPQLLARSVGHIVNLSSMGGFAPFPGQTMYGATKAAVKLMSEGLASELADTSVRVTVVFPGAIATNITANSGVAVKMNVNTSAGGAKMALPPAKAAEIIVNGIERNAKRLFVGRDSALIDKLYRLSPTLTAGLMARMMKAVLPA